MQKPSPRWVEPTMKLDSHTYSTSWKEHDTHPSVPSVPSVPLRHNGPRWSEVWDSEDNETDKDDNSTMCNSMDEYTHTLDPGDTDEPDWRSVLRRCQNLKKRSKSQCHNMRMWAVREGFAVLIPLIMNSSTSLILLDTPPPILPQSFTTSPQARWGWCADMYCGPCQSYHDILCKDSTCNNYHDSAERELVRRCFKRLAMIRT